MTVLSDRSIREMVETGHIGISPFDPARVQACSYDLALGKMLLLVMHTTDDGTQPEPLLLDVRGRWRLHPGRLYLGATAEMLTIPDDLVGHLHGRSTSARDGIMIHQQAGLLAPGYRGCPTLEITVVYPTMLEPGTPIAQVVFEQLTSPVERPYRGRYQGDRIPWSGIHQTKRHT